jgi:PAS domain S-box-containing protein
MTPRPDDRSNPPTSPTASTARWSDLLAHYPEAATIHVDGKIVYANAAAAKLVRADSASQLIGMDSLEFIPDDVRDHIERRMNELHEVPPLPSEEICITRMDGSPVWIRLQPVQIDYGGQDAIHTILVDVAEERKNRLSLQRRNRLITAGAVIGANLLRVIEVETALGEVLEEIRTACDASCVTLQRVGCDGKTELVVHSPSGANCPMMPLESAMTLAEPGHAVFGKPADLLPDGPSLVGVELISITPLQAGHEMLGVISLHFDHKVPGWSDDDMAALTVIGCSIGNAFERERIETRRRKSERKFRRLIEQASDGILVNDSDGTFVEVNEAACKMTGYDRQELLALTPKQLLTPESLAERPFDWDSLRPGDVRRHERIIRRKDATTFTAELSVTKNDDGLIQAILRDITDRVTAEDALRESRDRLALALESGRMGIWDLDVASGLVTWTPETAAIFGIPLDEFDGKLETIASLIHPDDRDKLSQVTATAIRTSDDFVMQCRVCRPDGAVIWIRSDGKVVTSNGVARRMIGTIINVTEAVRTQQSIRRKSSRIQGMLIALPDLVVRLTERKDGSIRIGAPRRQRSRETREARALHVPLPQRVRDQYERAFARLKRRNEAETFSYDLQDAEGRSRVFEVRVARSGEREAVAVVRDSTAERRREMELMQARDEAEEMSRLKSAFLANMSHEIRTPLTSIIGFSDILADQINEESAEFMQIIRASGERLMHTMNSVLDLAQIESGTVDLDVRPADLMERIRTAVDFYEPQARTKGLKLLLKTDPSISLPAVIDAAATDRVLSHILSNALKFTIEGSITVRAWSEDGSSCVSISDTGIGMSEQFQRRMFEPFFQESSGLARDYEGIGLGLAITRHLTGLMGATIEVESERGVGSTFTIRFPVAQPGRSMERASVDSTLPRTDQDSRKRVLVVDDDEITRLLVAQVLDDEFDVSTVATGEEAVDYVQDFLPDAVLLDVSLGGGIGGEDVVWKVRRLGFDDLPIIAVTGYTRSGDRERLLEAGFDGYVSKPFRREHLVAALRMTHHASSGEADVEDDLQSLLERCQDLGLIDGFQVSDGLVMLKQDIAYLKLPEDRASSALKVMLEGA